MTPAVKRTADERNERRAEQDRRLDALIEQLLRLRANDPPMSDEEIRRIRIEGRP